MQMTSLIILYLALQLPLGLGLARLLARASETLE